MKVTFVLFIFVKALLAQAQVNNMSGSCDQVVNDNRGVITITCSGVDKTLMEQLKKTADLLNRVASRQTDPAVLGSLKDLNVKMDEVLTDTRALKTSVAQANRQLAAERRQKEQTELLKRTSPSFDTFLRIDQNGNLLIMFDCHNLVPFEFRPVIAFPDNKIVPNQDGSQSVLMEMMKIYPSEGNTLFNSSTAINASTLAGKEIELRVRFQSLSYEELKLPSHSGEIVKKYRISSDGTALEPHS